MTSGSVNPTSTCAEGFLPGLWSSLWPERSAGMITPVLRAPGVTTSRRSTSRKLIAPPGTDWLPRRLSTKRPVVGIMWVTFGHLRPSGHIMPDHGGDRGAVLLVLAPHDHPAYQADPVRALGGGGGR